MAPTPVEDLEALNSVQWSDFATELLDYDLDSLVGLQNQLIKIEQEDHTPAREQPQPQQQQPAQVKEQDQPVVQVPAGTADSSETSKSIDNKSSNQQFQAKEEESFEVGADSVQDTSSGFKSGSINKATREKLRRERLNERFAELATLLNLKGANIDKLRVLSEAIHTLKNLRDEAKELKNTNHHLHLANTMTSEMAVSLMKAQNKGEDAAGQQSPQQDTTDAPTQQSNVMVTQQRPNSQAGPQQQQPSMASHMNVYLPQGQPVPDMMQSAHPPPNNDQNNSVKRQCIRDPMQDVMIQQTQTNMQVTLQQQPAKQQRVPSNKNIGANAYQLQMQAHKLGGPPVMTMPNGSVPPNAWMMAPNGMWVPANAPMNMSMWMPLASQDISQDHFLRPPAA